jgi:RNA polymerase sigma factor (TIGR02999 family)
LTFLPTRPNFVVKTKIKYFRRQENAVMANNLHAARGITEMLRGWRDHNGNGADPELLGLVYEELRRRAHAYLHGERQGHTLQTTALVHEAYLKLIDQRGPWENRAHFFAVAATVMRRILIDYARSQNRIRRGAGERHDPLDEKLIIAGGSNSFDLLRLNEALDRLAGKDPRLALLVELRFFAGLDVDETAKALGVSERTVKRDWRMAKAWLNRELTD